MNKILFALGIVLLAGATSYADWYAPEVVTTYYPAPVYAAPVPYLAPAPVVYSTYYAPPVFVARPRVAYMPVGPAYVAAPPMVVAPAPVVVRRPAVIRAKVYYPGHPIYNTVRYVLP